MDESQKYVALLRGINVGGHKKVPMAELRETFAGSGFKNIKTILATGNIIFESTEDNVEKLTGTIAEMIENRFGFPVPTIIRPFSTIWKIIEEDPFKDIEVTPDTRLNVTFLGDKAKPGFTIPYISPDGSFEIISLKDDHVFSVTDLGKTQTTEVMDFLKKEFGSHITTRTWKTVLKIGMS